MFAKGSYDPDLYNQAQLARYKTAKACRKCAETFAHDAFKLAAPKVDTRAKLVQFLSWQFDRLGYQNTDKITWIKEAMKSFNLAFKQGVI